jgi:DnaJ-class molecular chaperone
MSVPPSLRDFAKDLYRLLRLPRTASHTEIKRSYRELAMNLHPDRGHNCELRTREFKEVSEAYRILSDRTSRAEYDRWIEDVEFDDDGRVLKRRGGGNNGGSSSRAAERNPFYRRVYSPAAPPGMKTFDRQRHFGESRRP